MVRRARSMCPKSRTPNLCTQFRAFGGSTMPALLFTVLHEPLRKACPEIPRETVSRPRARVSAAPSTIMDRYQLSAGALILSCSIPPNNPTYLTFSLSHVHFVFPTNTSGPKHRSGEELLHGMAENCLQLTTPLLETPHRHNLNGAQVVVHV